MIGVVIGTKFSRDGKARRHRKAEARHFGEACAFAAEKTAGIRAQRRLAAAEGMHPARRAIRDFAARPGRHWLTPADLLSLKAWPAQVDPLILAKSGNPVRPS